jgi:hypothetical protein
MMECGHEDLLSLNGGHTCKNNARMGCLTISISAAFKQVQRENNGKQNLWRSKGFRSLKFQLLLRASACIPGPRNRIIRTGREGKNLLQRQLLHHQANYGAQKDGPSSGYALLSGAVVRTESKRVPWTRMLKLRRPEISQDDQDTILELLCR